MGKKVVFQTGKPHGFPLKMAGEKPDFLHPKPAVGKAGLSWQTGGRSITIDQRREHTICHYHLSESEYRFATILWENEPIHSGGLVRLYRQQLGWKKSTPYTVLKKLCDKGLFYSGDVIITFQVNQKLIQKQESQKFLDKVFTGSLPAF